ncbi:MAG: phage terminase large subunit [Deltaproteobacteria bacterium]|nr:phage terminase large subunit [Deltaproteobacteria bacterium]
MVHLPPRHGKSRALAHYAALLYLIHYPTRHWVTAAYGQELSQVFCSDCRDDYESLGPQIGVGLDPSQRSKDFWRTSRGGSYRAVGVETALTGFGADVLLIDDPVKDAQDAFSETIREKHWQWWLGVAEKRLEPNASVVLIMHRWTKDDLAGRLLADQTHSFEYIRLPSLAEENDPMGREIDAPLWPARYSYAYLDRLRRRGAWDWASLYQGRPTSQDGEIWRREWIRTYPATASGMMIQSWDLKVKDYATGSKAVGVVAAVENGIVRVIDVVRGDFGLEQVLGHISRVRDQYRTSAVLIEDRAIGDPVIRLLRGKVPGIVAIDPGTQSKEARAMAVQPFVAEGRLQVPASAPWLHDYLDELAEFPRGSYDDQVDATSQLLAYALLRHRTPDSMRLDAIASMNPWRV